MDKRLLIVNLLGPLLFLSGLVAYGYHAGGLAGLMVMSIFASFLIHATLVGMTRGWEHVWWIGIKWFVLFLALNFIIFCSNETLAAEMLIFIDSTFVTIQAMDQKVSAEARLVFLFGAVIVSFISLIILSNR